jgi:signal transduction histidine kinase
MKEKTLQVLLVEDNTADALLLREMFRKERPGSFELTHLLRMSEAVVHLRKGGVDIALLDLGLPDAHGLEAVRLAHAVAPDVPVIVLTGLDDEAIAAKAMKEGAQDYLVKGQVENRALPRALRYAIERQRMQADLIKTSEELKKLDEMKSNFISIAAHELRTPMTSVKNAVDLILTKKIGDITRDQEQFLLMAQRNINRLSGLVGDLLDISKIESGKFELLWTKIYLKQLIESVLITLRPLADKKSLPLHLNYSAEVPAIGADAGKIEQVLINLVNNSIKFTPEKGVITIDVRQMENVPDILDGVLGYVEISVSDTGIGISEEHRMHLFEKFYQVEGALSQKERCGTGLGLAISKGIIEAHGGKIWFASNEGKGSKFNFTLPIFDEEQPCFTLRNELSKAKLKTLPLSVLILNLTGMESLLKAHKEMDSQQVLNIVKERIISCGIKATDKIEMSPLSNEIILIVPDTDKLGAQALLKRILHNIEKEEAAIGDCFRSLITSIATYPEDGTSDKELIEFARTGNKKGNNELSGGHAAIDKKRVLIVDDEADIVESIRFTLELEGIECIVAHDGEDALAKAKKEMPDLVLLDVMLPKINGYKVSRLLKFDEAFKQIPIIMLTARAQGKDRQVGAESGADEYLTKPFEMTELVALVKKYTDV